MDKYDLEIFLKNIQYASRENIKNQIKNGDLDADNIAEIIFAFSVKLKKIRTIVNIFEDFDDLEYDEKLKR